MNFSVYKINTDRLLKEQDTNFTISLNELLEKETYVEKIPENMYFGKCYGYELSTPLALSMMRPAVYSHLIK